MAKVILAEQIRDGFTQEQADQRYLSKEGDIANGDITLNIADGRKAFSIADLDTGTYAYLASDNSQAELSLMSLQLTSNSNEASINSSTDIDINSYSHEVNLNGSSVNVPEPTTNTSAVPKSYVDSKFVSQESGKGLSTNDFTTEEKDKLAGVANNANNYTLPIASASTLGGVKVGSGLSISNGVLSAVSSGSLTIFDSGEVTVSSSWGSSEASVTLDEPAKIVIAYMLGPFGDTIMSDTHGNSVIALLIPGATGAVQEGQEWDGTNWKNVTLSSDGKTISLTGDTERGDTAKYIAIK